MVCAWHLSRVLDRERPRRDSGPVPHSVSLVRAHIIALQPLTDRCRPSDRHVAPRAVARARAVYDRDERVRRRVLCCGPGVLVP